MNLLDKVCKELGVEIGEVWLGNDGLKYKIDEAGDFTVYNKDNDILNFGYKYWENIFTGELKPVWKPKKGESYHTPVLDDEIMFTTYKWYDSNTDELLRERGLVFKTAEEAEDVADRILKSLKEDK